MPPAALRNIRVDQNLSSSKKKPEDKVMYRKANNHNVKLMFLLGVSFYRNASYTHTYVNTMSCSFLQY